MTHLKHSPVVQSYIHFRKLPTIWKMENEIPQVKRGKGHKVTYYTII